MVKLNLDKQEIKEYKVNKKSRKKRPLKSNAYLKELAQQVYRGEVFTSFQIQNPQDIASVFMPLMLMSPDMGQGMYQDKPCMFYANMKDRFPTGINGYPCFGSVAYLNSKEAEIFDNYYKKIEKAINEI
tara:strand:+ start:54 stop:440 length:387 start_codon:yes stop_codon:yes gene_type:complete